MKEGKGKKNKQTKQQLVCEYLRENYLDHGRLRYDLIADKLQIRGEAKGNEAMRREAGSSGSAAYYQPLTSNL